MTCDNHQPQTEGFPWAEFPGMAWCPNCGGLELNGQDMGRAKPDKTETGGWLYWPVIPLNWISVTVMLDEALE